MKRIVLSFIIFTNVVLTMEKDKKQQFVEAFRSLPCNAITQFISTFNAMNLDAKTIKEFIDNKKEIIEECIDCELQTNGAHYRDDQNNPREDALYELKWHNKLFEAYYAISQMQPAQAETLIGSQDIQSKLQQLQAIAFASPEYHEKLAKAQLTNNPEDWQRWRYKAGDDLIKPFLKDKGLQVPEKRSTYDHVKANATISKETAAWLIAHSAFLYKNRDVQRVVTGQDLPPIKIRSDKK